MEHFLEERFIRTLDINILSKLVMIPNGHQHHAIVSSKPLPYIRVGSSIRGYNKDGLLYYPRDEKHNIDDNFVSDFMENYLSETVTGPFEPYTRYDFDSTDTIYYDVEYVDYDKSITIGFLRMY